LFEQSPICSGEKPYKHCVFERICDKNSPKWCGEFLSVIYSLARLIVVERIRFIPP